MADVSIRATGQCGENLTWTIDSEDVLTISGEGDMYDYYANGQPWPTDVFHSLSGDSIKSVIILPGVTSIGEYAFAYFHNMVSVSIPDSVTSIGEYAFAYCHNIEAVSIPDSVTSIGESAFIGCDGLADENGFIVVNDVLFQYCGDEESLTVPSDIKRISTSAFSFNMTLKYLTIGEGVESLADGAFSGAFALKSVTIPKSLTAIGDGNFSQCIMLDEISVDAENPEYKDVDGVLFDKSGKKLIAFPIGKTVESYDIPDGVEEIGFGAFNSSGAEWIAGIIALIDPDCADRGIKSISIPKSIKKIDVAAFLACDKLTDVYFSGTEEEWSLVEIVDDYEYYDDDHKIQVMEDTNASLKNAVFHFHVHSFDEAITPPTCTEQGYTTYTCSCGESYTGAYVPATGHRFELGKCSVCGADDPNYKPNTPAPSGNFFSSLLDSIRNIFHNIFGWLPFC